MKALDEYILMVLSVLLLKRFHFLAFFIFQDLLKQTNIPAKGVTI